MEISFSTLLNLALAMLCIAVTVQSIRLDRSLKALRAAGIGQNVTALDAATGRAKQVLSQLKATLERDGVACAKAVESAKEASDELNLMVKIGASMADRLVEAAEAAPKSAAAPEPVTKKAPAARKKAAAKPKTAVKKPAAKKPAAKKAPARKAPAKPRKAASKKVEASATDIKVSQPPMQGQRTLRLVESGKPETKKAAAA